MAMAVAVAEDRSGLIDQGSDEALVAAMQAGDERALESLIGRHGPYLAVLVARIAGGNVPPADIEEAVSDCFTAAWRMASNYEPRRGSVVAWLTHIAHYKGLTLRRRKYRARPASLSDVSEAQLPLSNADFTEETVTRLASESQLNEIRNALGSFSQQDIDLVLMRFSKELTPQEISIQLGITPNAVRVRLSRTLARLRHALQSANAAT